MEYEKQDLEEMLAMFPPDERPLPLTRESLESMPDELLEPSIAWYVITRMQSDEVSDSEALHELPEEFDVVCTSASLQEEVTSGGFSYFCHAAGPEEVERALWSLREIGAEQHAALLALANERYLENADAIDAAVEAWEEDESEEAEYPEFPEIDVLDDEFLDLLDEIEDLRTKYIRDRLDIFTVQ
jgi:hypothetical protein